MDLVRKTRRNIFEGLAGASRKGPGRVPWAPWVVIAGLTVSAVLVLAVIVSGLRKAPGERYPDAPRDLQLAARSGTSPFRGMLPDFTRLADMSAKVLGNAWDDTDKPEIASDLADESPVLAHIYQYLRTHSAAELSGAADAGVGHSDLVRSPDQLRGRVLNLRVKLMRKHGVLSLPDNASGVRDVGMLFCYGSATRGANGTFVVLAPRPPEDFQEGADYVLTGVFMKRYPYRDVKDRWQWQPLILAVDMPRANAAAAIEGRENRAVAATSAGKPGAYKSSFRAMDAEFTSLEQLDTELLAAAWDDFKDPALGNALGKEADIVFHIYRFLRSRTAAELTALADPTVGHRQMLCEPEEMRGKVINLRGQLLRTNKVFGWPDNAAGIHDTGMLFFYGLSSPGDRGKYVVLIPKPLEDFEEGRAYELNGVFMKRYAFLNADGVYEWQPLILALDAPPAPAAARPGPGLGYAVIGAAVFGGLLLFFLLRGNKAEGDGRCAVNRRS